MASQSPTAVEQLLESRVQKTSRDGQESYASSLAEEDLDHENTMSILVASDNHIGYMEKDPERGSDSLVTFEEILQIAQEKKVDFILLGGDLFHENKPSRKVLHKTMEILRKYCMGEKPCYLEFLSDQSINFAANSFPTVNYEDPNYNISIPLFSIHGNHDDPAGDGNLCTLNLFSVSGLVNYFGKATNVDDITISPILMQKGRTKLALFGLGSVRDERLHRTFMNRKVKMLRPKEDADSWFNCFVLHQNRAKHGARNHIPEQFLDEFLDLVIWGHEHECLIDPQWSESDKDFYISQPGSSVATSLCEGEAKRKYVGILRVVGKNFRMDKVPLRTVRPFYTRDVILSETDIEPSEEEAVQEYLVEQVDELIAMSELEHTGDSRQPKLPLIRIRVEYSGGFSPFNVNRFGQQFVKRVANTKDILLFFRKKVSAAREKRNGDVGPVRIRPEVLDDIRVEDLVNEYLNSQENNLQLSILSERKMRFALQEFVEKDEKEAIQEIVKLQLRDTQKTLSTKNVRDEDIVKEVMKETERSRAEEPSQKEEARTRKDFEEAVRQSKSHRLDEPDSLSDDSDGERQNAKPTRGRGRGRGRGSRGTGRGSRTTSKTSDTSRAPTRGRKQPVVEEDVASFSTKQSRINPTFSRYSWNNTPSEERDEEEDPFAFPLKRQRR